MKLFYQQKKYPSNGFLKFLIMVKLTLVFLITIFLQQGQSAEAQYITVSRTNVPLSAVLKEIRVQIGYDYFFEETTLENSKLVTVNIKNGTLEEVLTTLFKDQPFTYSISEKTIIIRTKPKPINIKNSGAELKSSSDMQGVIEGKVVDETGESLVGVSVLLKGTTQGTSTNIDGKFSISVKPGDILVFTYIGFIRQEVAIINESFLNVRLAKDKAMMEEVVVTALGISREKKSLGYSSQAVSGDDINTVNTGNVTNALSGKVSGVQIKRNSNIGGSTNIVIRGNKSLTGDNQALWVVDGIPIDNSNLNVKGQNTGSGATYDYGNMASDINQDDIESINVLKGAAATALYGSRAANGAIIITTKAGAKGMKSQITVNSNVTTGSIDKSTFPTFQKEYGAGLGAVYGTNRNSYFNSGDPDGDGVMDLLVPYVAYGSFGAPYDKNLLVYDWKSLDPESPNYLKKTPWVAPANGPETFFEKPLTTINNIALAGSGDNSNYRFSYTNYFQDGMMPNSKVKRDNVAFNSSFKLNQKLTVGGNANYVYSDVLGRNMTGGTGSNQGNNPVATFRQWWQTHVDIQELKSAYFSTGRNVSNFAGGTIDNVYWNQYQIYSTDTRNRLFGNVNLKYEFNDWLNLDGRVSIDSYNFTREERRNSGSTYPGKYDRLSANFREINYDLMLNFKRQLSDKFNVSGVLGTNIRRNYLETVNMVTNGGLIVPGLYAISNSLSVPAAPIENLTQIGVNGVYGLVSFGYNNFLFLDVTGRNDWSSTLPAVSNSYFYPSVATSLIFSELIQSDVLSFGKLRVNYAKVGNGAPPLSITDVLQKPSPFGTRQMYGVTDNKKNENLKPESTSSFEAGIESQFFGNRVGFDVSYYKTNTKDQIMPVAISPATGYASKFVNAGEVENKGVEFTISGAPVKSEKFNWNVNLNWSKNQSKVLYLFDGVDNLVLGSRINATVGRPYGTITGRDFIYVNDQKQVNQTTGEYMLTQANNYVIGNINPDWIGGIRNNFSYKNFNFNFLIDIQHGGDVFSSDMQQGNRNGLYDNLVGLNDLGNPMRNSLAAGGGLILEGVDAQGNPNKVRTRMDYYAHALGSLKAPEAMFIYDASYVKLREASLSYKMPASMLKNSKIKGVQFKVSGSNLWIIHKNLPYSDPEAGLSSGNVQGIQTGVLPTVREFGFGVNVQF